MFARKIIQLGGSFTREVVEAEFRAVDILTRSSNKNIVKVIDHGDLELFGRCFIDMELCDLNLHTYIYEEWKPKIVQDLPYFTIQVPPRMKTGQTWNIMGDVTNGLIYIHSLGQVHRDIKPQNGKASS